MTLHVFLLIFTMAFVTILLRFLPYLIFRKGGSVPEIIRYLGRTLTAATIAMLVVYGFYGSLDWGSCGPQRLPAGFLAALLTVLLHYFLKNPLVSIVCGTALYMILI